MCLALRSTAESHSASFSLLVYVSAWLKRYHPAAFTGALLNSLPMGFYGPAQLVADARRHGVDVRPPDVAASDWDCTLESRVRLDFQCRSSVSKRSDWKVESDPTFAASSAADARPHSARAVLPEDRGETAQRDRLRVIAFWGESSDQSRESRAGG